MDNGTVQVEAVCPRVIWDVVKIVRKVAFLLYDLLCHLAVPGGGDGYQVWTGHGKVGLQMEVLFHWHTSDWKIGEDGCQLKHSTLEERGFMIMGRM